MKNGLLWIQSDSDSAGRGRKRNKEEGGARRKERRGGRSEWKNGLRTHRWPPGLVWVQNSPIWRKWIMPRATSLGHECGWRTRFLSTVCCCYWHFFRSLILIQPGMHQKMRRRRWRRTAANTANTPETTKVSYCRHCVLSRNMHLAVGNLNRIKHESGRWRN